MRYHDLRISLPIQILLVLAASWTTVYSQSAVPLSPNVRTTITYCDLGLSPQSKLANLSFNVLYSIQVNSEGEIREVKKIRDAYVGDSAVRACLSGWRIAGFPEGSKFSVYFFWKHGKGWVRQEISGNGYQQIMTMENVGVDTLKTP